MSNSVRAAARSAALRRSAALSPKSKPWSEPKPKPKPKPKSKPKPKPKAKPEAKVQKAAPVQKKARAFVWRSLGARVSVDLPLSLYLSDSLNSTAIGFSVVHLSCFSFNFLSSARRRGGYGGGASKKGKMLRSVICSTRSRSTFRVIGTHTHTYTHTHTHGRLCVE